MVCGYAPLPAQHVDVDGDEDHAADDDGLPFLRDRHDPQAVGEHGDDERADDRADDRALAALQRRAADDHGGDRLELEAHARRRLGRAEPRRGEHAGDADEQAGERVDDDLPLTTLTPDSAVASSLLPIEKV